MNLSAVKDTAISNVSSTPVEFSTSQLISADGTTIGYRQIGHGPGLVIMHGALRSSLHYQRLASTLADRCTVYIRDRRGRGLSGPVGDSYSLAKECEDLAAVLKKTHARRVFGHSGGGLLALESALKLPIDKLILYESAVSINGSLPLYWLPDNERVILRQDYTGAMAVFIRGLPLNWMSKLPYFVLRPLFSLMLRSDEAREIIELLPTGVHEARLSQSLDSTYQRYRHIAAEILLLGGSKSPAYLLDILPVLAEIILHARLINLPGLNHTSPNDEDAPEAVAAVLKQFLVTK